ncbi:MAG: diaminopimelate decarboxylase [Endomicrobiaceae bacterium]
MEIKYVNNELYVEEMPVSKLAKKYGTPIYIYSKKTLISNFDAYKKGFGDIDSIICYAAKANSNQNIMTILAKLGSGADIVSGGELYRSLLAGIRPDKIVYSGVGKTAEEIEYALKSDILMFNVESFEELQQINLIAKRLHKKARISLRVNPDVDPHTHKHITTGKHGSKFGIRYEDAFDMYMAASKMTNIEIVGVDSHIGSQILEVAPFKQAAVKLSNLIDKLEKAKIVVKYIDIGGGLGIKYQKTEKPPTPEELKKAVMSVYSKYKNKTIIVEPGRSIVASAGIMVGKVLYRKVSGDKKFIIVDMGMNDLIRPTLYDAYHNIIPVKKTSKKPVIVDIVGPICETGDFIAKDRKFPMLSQGELIAVECIGAYGSAMASQYNSRLRAQGIVIDGKKVTGIRKREEFKDLIAKEI